ncbi:MAG: methyltransferase domain-containing protein [Paracoccaceae bacterium]
MTDPTNDWNPGAYAKFRGLRLRPALDLLAQVGALPAGDVIDLGCGDGAVGPPLAARFPDRPRIGVDLSPAMLERARATGGYDRLDLADIATWVPETPPALIFSNAALQWLDRHEVLIPRLAGLLAPGGVLAVQMPRQQDAPSHRLMRETAMALFPGRFTGEERPVAQPPALYARLLAGSGAASVWETEYLQRLAPVAQGHPVRHFTASTGMRPILAQLDEVETAAYLAAYDAALTLAYPAEADGSVFFPFRRLFFMLSR